MALICPRCKEAVLEEIEVGDVVIDRCTRCAGIWFDSAEIAEIVGRRSQVGRFESIVPSNNLSEPSLHCPRCDDVPLRKYVSTPADERDHTVYRCVSCIGTWLDRGELKELEDSGLPDVLRSYFSKVD